MEAALARLLPKTAAAAPVNAVAATRVLTMSVQPTAGDTLTIGDWVYTFVAAGTAEAWGEVNLGADLAATKPLLVAAINGDEFNPANTLVTAGDFSTHAMTITARTKGTAANAIETTETFTSGSNTWAGATMTGGVNGTFPGDYAGPYEMLVHGGYLYVNISDLAEEGVTVDSWYRVQLTIVS